jgi:hypothetical protein
MTTDAIVRPFLLATILLLTACDVALARNDDPCLVERSTVAIARVSPLLKPLQHCGHNDTRLEYLDAVSRYIEFSGASKLQADRIRSLLQQDSSLGCSNASEIAAMVAEAIPATYASAEVPAIARFMIKRHGMDAWMEAAHRISIDMAGGKQRWTEIYGCIEWMQAQRCSTPMSCRP